MGVGLEVEAVMEGLLVEKFIDVCFITAAGEVELNFLRSCLLVPGAVEEEVAEGIIPFSESFRVCTRVWMVLRSKESPPATVRPPRRILARVIVEESGAFAEDLRRLALVVEGREVLDAV